jgi:hypothetical protein
VVWCRASAGRNPCRRRCRCAGSDAALFVITGCCLTWLLLTACVQPPFPLCAMTVGVHARVARRMRHNTLTKAHAWS